MKISQEIYNNMPANIQAMFRLMPNPSRDEVMELFPQTGASSGGRIGNKGSALNMMGTNFQAGDPGYGDSGSAARFFYCAKASRKERNAGLEGMPVGNGQRYGSIRANRGNGHHEITRMQNTHPSVKPLKLMQYLARLTKTPTGGTLFDPFMGSGSTGCAAIMEGRSFYGIEKDPEYYEIAKRRIKHAENLPMREPVMLPFEPSIPIERIEEAVKKVITERFSTVEQNEKEEKKRSKQKGYKND